MCKDIVIIETNFVVGYSSKEFNDIVEQLQKQYEVYITQVSIDERLAQRYNMHKEKYEKLVELASIYREYADITIRKDFEDFVLEERERSIAIYKEKFGSNIIDFLPDNNCLNVVIERAYRKISPFNPDPKSSDKGFKDTLIWLSILQFFEKNKTGANITFLSSDKAFTDHEDILKSEFEERTGMTIEIRQNSHYKALLGQYENPGELPTKELEPKVLSSDEQDKIRKIISEVMYDFTKTWLEEYPDGDSYLADRFTLRQVIDDDKAVQLLESLPSFISKNIFVEDIDVSDWFRLLDIDATDNATIPIIELQKLQKMYTTQCKAYPEYIPQIVHAINTELNRTYRAYPDYDENDLPF